MDGLFVDEFFEKQHKHVLRDIAKITEPTSGFSEEFIKNNFISDFYDVGDYRVGWDYRYEQMGRFITVLKDQTGIITKFDDAMWSRYSTQDLCPGCFFCINAM